MKMIGNIKFHPVTYESYCVELWNAMMHTPVRVVLKGTTEPLGPRPCFEGKMIRYVDYPDTIRVFYEDKYWDVPYIKANEKCIFSLQVRIYCTRYFHFETKRTGWVRCGDGALTLSGEYSLRTSSDPEELGEYPKATVNWAHPIMLRPLPQLTSKLHLREYETYQKLSLENNDGSGWEIQIQGPFSPCSIHDHSIKLFPPHITAIYRETEVVTEKWILARLREVLGVRGQSEQWFLRGNAITPQHRLCVAYLLMMHSSTRPYVQDTSIPLNGNITPSDEPTLCLGLPGDCEDTAMSTYQIAMNILLGEWDSPLVNRVQHILVHLGIPAVLFSKLKVGMHSVCVLIPPHFVWKDSPQVLAWYNERLGHTPPNTEATILDGIMDTTPYFRDRHYVDEKKLKAIQKSVQIIGQNGILWDRFHTKAPMDIINIHEYAYQMYSDFPKHIGADNYVRTYLLLYGGKLGVRMGDLVNAEFRPVCTYTKEELEEELSLLRLFQRPVVCLDENLVDFFVPNKEHILPPPPSTQGEGHATRLMICAYGIPLKEIRKKAEELKVGLGLDSYELRPYGYSIAIVFKDLSWKELRAF